MDFKRFFCLFILFSSFIFGQKIKKNSLYPLYKDVVFTLADDSMKGRFPGTIEEMKALDFIFLKMKSFSGKFKSEKHNFSIAYKNSTLNASNGLFFIDNHSEKTILIGAHYDHIGYGGDLSAKFITDKIHNGADDNASGVAITMGLASRLAKLEGQKYNYLFVFYSGHEIGLFGSAALGNYLVSKSNFYKNVSCVINLDMVGRFDSDLKVLKCMKTSSFDSFLEKTKAEDFGIKLNIGNEDRLEKLDTHFFYKLGIPCANFTTGLHLDYHSPDDDASYINFDGMEIITDFLFNIIVNSEK